MFSTKVDTVGVPLPLDALQISVLGFKMTREKKEDGEGFEVLGRI